MKNVQRSCFRSSSSLVLQAIKLSIVFLLYISGSALASPNLVSPVQDSKLVSTDQTFEWDYSSDTVNGWWLYVGSSSGGRQYFDSGFLAEDTREIDVTNLPTGAEDLYIRLWFRTANGWDSDDYQFEASGELLKPTISFPLANSTISGRSTNLEWDSAGLTISSWWVFAGVSEGSNSIFDSGLLQGSQTEIELTNLPENGSDLFVRLWFRVDGDDWSYVDTQYSLSSSIPEILTPVAESEISSTTVSVSWTEAPSWVTGWWVTAGLEEGGSDVFNSSLIPTSQQSIEIEDFPLIGAPVYVRLWYRHSGGWSSVDSSVLTVDSQETPSIVNPVTGLDSGSVLVNWSSNGSSVTNWWLSIGTSIGADDLYSSGYLNAATDAKSVGGLPLDGSAVYFRLWYKRLQSPWEYVDTQVDSYVAVPNNDDYDLVFNDEFSEPNLDGRKWNTGFLWGPYLPINAEEQLYVDTQGINEGAEHTPFVINDGILSITATETTDTLLPPARPPETDPIWDNFDEYRFNGSEEVGGGYDPANVGYLSGLLTSYDAFKFTHGYAEARLKLPAGRGLWPAFWLLNTHYVETSPEIDVVEFLGQDVSTIYHTYHYFDIEDNWRKISTPSYETVGEDWTDTFHTFAVSWSPDEIVWYVDGVETRRIDSSDYLIPNQAMYVLLNLAVGGNWPGSPDSSTIFPAVFEVDYVRVYKKAVAEPVNLAEDYDLVFSDEFNGSQLDASKWNSSYLWGPYLPINNEEQYYVDALGSDTGKGYSPFAINNGVLSIIADSSVNSGPDLPPEQLPESADSIWSSFPTYHMNSNYESPPYTSGVLTTYDEFKFVNGYAEVRAKIPSGDGFWPAFWLLNGYYVGPQPEIDVMESVGENTNEIHHSFHRLNNNGVQISDSTAYSSGVDFSEEFHTYGVQWKRGKITWYVDGIATFTHEGEDVPYQVMYVLLNLAVGGNFNTQPVDESLLPVTFDIDYVRVYQEKIEN